MNLATDLDYFLEGNINDLKELINNHLKGAEKTITPSSLTSFSQALLQHKYLQPYFNKCAQYYRASKEVHPTIKALDAINPGGSLFKDLNICYSAIHDHLSCQQKKDLAVETSPFLQKYMIEIENCVVRDSCTYLRNQLKINHLTDESSTSIKHTYLSTIQHLFTYNPRSQSSRVKEIYTNTLYCLMLLSPIEHTQKMQLLDFETTTIRLSTTLNLLEKNLHLLPTHPQAVRVNESFFCTKHNKSPLKSFLTGLQTHLHRLQNDLYGLEIESLQSSNPQNDSESHVKQQVSSLEDIMREFHFEASDSKKLFPLDETLGFLSKLSFD
ncbi:MAG: hypothetical protein H2069_06305 [Legionella sp.]|nr:hypothetical protein [Legionella sp.]